MQSKQINETLKPNRIETYESYMLNAALPPREGNLVKGGLKGGVALVLGFAGFPSHFAYLSGNFTLNLPIMRIFSQHDPN